MDVVTWIGPQSDGDPSIVRRHRFHQSWYRAFVLGLQPGKGPQQRATTRYGNMLRAEDAASGRNFLTEEIYEVAERRIAAGGTVEPFRCQHNMLSSQPMCFNLIAPLQSRPSLAAAFVKSVTGRDVEVEEHGVRLEDSPGHLGDATGLDASIRYRTSGGQRGVLGIETKLTERFSPKVYGLDSKPAYRRYSEAGNGPFDRSQLEALTDARWNQLWRNQMLCEAIADHEQREHAEQLVLFPDDAGETALLVAAYSDLLRHRDVIAARTLTEVVTALAKAIEAQDLGWLESFRVRYVDLELSRPLYDAWRTESAPFN